MSDEHINNDENPENETPDTNENEVLQGALPVSGMYENWFLEYASYVILERAVPHINDGLKPVQRRIMHAMYEMDDGRFNKVANIIGQTMQYHPHGDASIGDALVGIGQKELLVETQGNWGDIRTGDSAAAPRYIEARLSKFALDVVFNPKTTEWQLSYDGRKREPVTLPLKFPLLLAQGVEGIAVGLATKIMPHNFCELIQASINLLKNKPFELYPDFLTGGMIDVSNYQKGERGGKIRVRAKIEEVDNKTLAIKNIPFFTTTNGLIESIIKANDSGKLKIKKVIDNTAKDVEIVVQLAPGVSPGIAIDGLYAFTDCEVSISPNACVIVDDKPVFLTVDEILRLSTENTKQLLKQELDIRMGELADNWHYSSLEKIFIENRIYRDIEEEETWEGVLTAIDKGLDPFKKLLRREVSQDDIIRLTEIKIKRISKFDAFKADEHIRNLEDEMKEVQQNLDHLVDYAVKYFENLLKKYGKGRERQTEIRTFDTIQANLVAVNNQKLYVNREEGFVGYGLKKDEFISECSDIDDIIIFRNDGKMLVTKITDKSFVGKGIIHVGVFHKTDDRMVYNMIYGDGKTGTSRVKRFNVGGITRDKEYDLTTGKKDSKVLYFTANPNGEAEIVTVQLSTFSKAKKLTFDFDFSTLAVKGRGSQGNILSRHLVKNVKFKQAGVSTLGAQKIWYDTSIGRLNTEERGKLIGSFDGDDKILVVFKSGDYELTNFELTNHYEPSDVVFIKKYNPNKAITVVYFDNDGSNYYIKRFLIETQTVDKKFRCIADGAKNYIVGATDHAEPELHIVYGKKKDGHEETMPLAEYDIKGWKAVGSKVNGKDVSAIELLQKEEIEEEEEELDLDTEDDGGDENAPKAPMPDPVLDELLKSRAKTPPTAPVKTEQSKLFDL
jgi:topoisomerase IV subunit A